ncbi:CidA/LrgA family holin-like protein [Gracilibacillus sp. S3-1-1]|uniref:CidA/LrgA family holin-like protein n=1 Tax=Gracilibacillus pellucidus TaxID=3095368 RepID=A0ACC6M9K4_9BACI|nr:CidA/LrgA family holin-like protein [Gracilibacillus sp. S3-1-1]MDX8047665.1 CidA/LrgA family holin-like protein [Gracilibacillus sp. S3-1-1]
MKYVKIILQISVLFLFYYIGEAIQSAFSLFIPGSIIGMMLFFVLLLGKIIRVEWISDGVDLLMRDMPIFFIPVTIGVVEYLNFFVGKGSLMIPLIIFSTLIIITVSSLITSLLLKKEANAHE